jgi:PIN domain nuclease of toxin-antitoxin system
VAIDEDSLIALAGLPILHRDPFDRIIVAQAVQHQLRLVTVDGALKAYGEPGLPES